MSNYLRGLRRFVGGVGVAMLLLLVTFVSFPDGEAQANSIISQIGLDIDGEAAGDESGLSMAMSADGSRVAIGALLNDGTGLNAGHVRVYTLTNNGWTQTGGDIDGEAAGDWSGYPVAMSAGVHTDRKYVDTNRWRHRRRSRQRLLGLVGGDVGGRVTCRHRRHLQRWHRQ